MIAPFPYFGGKSRIAPAVWQRLGDAPNFVDPFCGSLALLLARPAWDEARGNWVDDTTRTETVNDADGYISNFWRAVQADPDAVAHHADSIIHECDLHARHLWLLARRVDLVARLMGDPEYYDAQVAGWWVWGICQWIGSGWCSGSGPWHSVDGKLVKGDTGGINRQLPHLGTPGQGINRKRPHLGNTGRGINRQLPHLGDAGQCDDWSAHLQAIMRQLSNRLRRVRVTCGDWSRVVGPSPTTALGMTAVFLDPPYSADAMRNMNLYSTDSGDVAHAAREWAIAHGDDPLLRIALCGYESEHNMPASWSVLRWSTHGGYAHQGNGQGEVNRHRETVWFSPHCLPENEEVLPLFATKFEQGDE